MRLFLAALVLAALPTPAHAAWGDHTAVADQWMADVTPATNDYGTPSQVWYTGATLNVFAECGGFVSELIKASYPNLDDDVMSALVDDDPEDDKPWASPDSIHFYNAIVDQSSTTAYGLTFAFSRLTDVDDLDDGDLLVSAYTSAGGTGHTMVIDSMPTTFAPVTTNIPGYSGVLVERYTVGVLDSTQSVHLNQAGTTDTRYRTAVDSAGKVINDKGMGTGHIHLYADAATGAVIGWSWSTIQGTPYQGTDPSLTTYRPIVAGRLGGTGI